MAELKILTQFINLFDETKQCLKTYNLNVKNELFEVEPNEELNKAYKRGEIIYDRCEDDLNNLNNILEKKEQIDKFFETCEQNKTNLIKQKNLIIDKLLRIKKNYCRSKEEYLDYREEWNKKRIESPDEKNRRECEEMLDEIKEEKKIVQEMTMNMIKAKKRS